jgi:hypothetical protein
MIGEAVGHVFTKPVQMKETTQKKKNLQESCFSL